MLRFFQQFKAKRLIDTFQYGTIRENYDTVHKLSAMGEAAVVPLLKALTSDNRRTQSEAVTALGLMRSERSLGPLAELAKGLDPDLAKEARAAIERILAKGKSTRPQ